MINLRKILEEAVEEMADQVVRKFGFEDSYTIAFFVMLEEGVDIDILQDTYEKLMNLKVALDE